MAPVSFHVAHAAEISWTSDYAAACEQAEKEDKDLLIDFTGSDWCAWCIKLRKEVFDQPAFAKAAGDRYVFVELDYPKDKTRVSEEVAKQNEMLLKKYPIKGYPSILLCDPDGRPFAVTAYQAGGPEIYVKHLAELQERKAARDKGFADAEKQEGVTKAQALIKTLEAMELDPAMIQGWYADTCSEIKRADPSDETGFARKENAEIKFAEFMAKLGELRSKQDLDGVDGLVKETLADPAMEGPIRMQVYGHHAGTLASAGKKPEAIAVLGKALEESPDGPHSKELRDFIVLLEKEIAGLPPVSPRKAEGK